MLAYKMAGCIVKYCFHALHLVVQKMFKLIDTRTAKFTKFEYE